MTSKWKETSKQLPECNAQHESDYLLCATMGLDAPFVAWFNCKKDKWIAALAGTSNDAVAVTHWQELPEMPA